VCSATGQITIRRAPHHGPGFSLWGDPRAAHFGANAGARRGRRTPQGPPANPLATRELGLDDGGVRVAVGVTLLGNRGGGDDEDGSVGVLEHAVGHASQQQ
jgi:hypothetical protein